MALPDEMGSQQVIQIRLRVVQVVVEDAREEIAPKKIVITYRQTEPAAAWQIEFVNHQAAAALQGVVPM